MAVHGLSHGFGSWTWPENDGRSWLEHLFTVDLEKNTGCGIRIMTFSYSPEAADVKSLVCKVIYAQAQKLVEQLRSSLRNPTRTTLISAAGESLVPYQPDVELETYLERLTNEPEFLSENWERFERCDWLVTRILCISAILADAPIPVGLIKSMNDFPGTSYYLWHIKDEGMFFQTVASVISYLVGQNLFYPVPRDSEYAVAPDSPSVASPHQCYLLSNIARRWILHHLTGDQDLMKKTARIAWMATITAIKQIRRESEYFESPAQYLSDIQAFDALVFPHAKKCHALRDTVLPVTGEEMQWRVLGDGCMAHGAVEEAAGCNRLALETYTPYKSRPMNDSELAEMRDIRFSLTAIYLYQMKLQLCCDVLNTDDTSKEITDLVQLRILAEVAAALNDNDNAIGLLREVEER
ncbi:hypothetical protein B0H66DRAFT_642841 [Apodospora peruviana]|uniref:Uncharacterized protein n=1 Tax=Apodospora peruviana TaxID=516989 RepID=A0AAE0M1K9_9PEZI|nr:hypothetical protein B0H66DRAFT_642841 [Apodospora peruviana]